MKHGRNSKEKSTWYQDHTSKIIETKSKSIRPNRIRFNSHIRSYHALRCGQLKVSRTCRFDVGTSIFLFDNSTPNLTATSSTGASVQLITYNYRPSGPTYWWGKGWLQVHVCIWGSQLSPYVYGNFCMHMWIVQSLIVCIKELFAYRYRDLGHQIPICEYAYGMGICCS